MRGIGGYMRVYIALAAFILGASNCLGQINPRTQIRWPTNCAASNMVYSWQSNSCIAIGGQAGNPAGSNGQVQYNAAGAFAGATGLFYDSVNSRLGIGTTSPAYTLDVNGAINLTGTLYQNGAPFSGMTYPPAGVPVSTGTAWGASILGLTGDGSNGIIVTGTAKAATMNVTSGYQLNGVALSAANVGAEPALGNPASSGYVLSSTAAGVRSWVAITPGGTNGQMQYNNNGVFAGANVVYNAALGFVGIGASPSAELDISSSNTTFLPASSSVLRLTNTSTTGQSPLDFYVNGTLRGRMRTDYVGNLTFVANGGSYSFMLNGDAGVGTSGMTIANNGNVGIGLNPAYQLDVNGFVRLKGYLLASNNANTNSWSVIGADVTDSIVIGSGASSSWQNLHIYTNGTEHATVLANGNAGINSTSPVATLHVNAQYVSGPPSVTVDQNETLNINNMSSVQLIAGGYANPPYAFWLQTKQSNNSGSAFPIVLNPVGGAVGIGLIAPAFTFDVNGDINASGNVYAGAKHLLSIPNGTSFLPNNCTGFSGTLPHAGINPNLATFTTSFNGDVTGINGWGANGGLVLILWPTTGTINYRICNQYSASITMNGNVGILIGVL